MTAATPSRGGAATEASPAAWTPAWSAAEGAAVVREGFAAFYDGAEPDGVWSAPGRVNVIGEHTDYNGGLCLPMALPHRTYAALRRRDDGVIRLAWAAEPEHGVWTGHLADLAPGTADGWASYAAGVAWAMREAGYAVGGFDAVLDSCVPFGSGLSSSAALECAVAVALDEVYHLGLGGDDAGRTVLAGLCVRAENEMAGAATGGMDQAVALRSTAGHALLLDCRDLSVHQIPLDLAASGLALLVTDTKAKHELVDGQYASRRAACEAAAALLGVDTLREIDPAHLQDALSRLGDEVSVRRVRHVVTEIARVREVVGLLDAGDVAAIGPVLAAGHRSLREDYEVSCAELDLAVDAAVAAGALGARMVGGGFGGSTISLVRAGSEQAVAEAVAAAFADAGFRTPAFLVAQASAPAG